MAAIEHAFGSLTPLLQEYGVAAVALILMLESLGLPVPGESLLILASVLAARGDLSLPPLLVFAWAGAVVGLALASSMICLAMIPLA
jgi:membrane protein DedA with SNARE-associated domain